MTGIFIQNIESPAQIVTPGVYGADFKCSIYNQENNTFLMENLQLIELIEPITITTTSITNNYIKDETEIELNSTIGFIVSDRIKINNYIYSISAIFGNNITLSKGLKENITAGDSASKKGNLGIYKLDLLLSDMGDYTLIAKDNIFGLNISQMIKVVPKSLETMYKDIKNLEYAILGA